MNLQVKIIPNEFVKEDGDTKKVKTAQTALVTFFDDDGKMEKEVEYGYKDPEEILTEINVQGCLNLSYCYVNDIGEISTEYPFLDGILAKNALFDGDINFCGKTISGKADFRDATFNSFVDFRGTKFIDKSDFGGAKFNHVADFEKAIFNEDALFRGTTFKGMAEFCESEFKKKAIFAFAKFYSKIEFSGGKFCIGADFSNIKVCDSSNFVRVIFDGKVLITRAVFHGVVLFSDVVFKNMLVISDSTFNEKTDFDKCTFNVIARFNNVVFRDSLSFGFAKVNCELKLLSIKFLSYTNLQFVKCEHLSLCDCVFEKACTILSHSSYQSVEIHGCTTTSPFSIPYDNDLKKAIYEGKKRIDEASKKIHTKVQKSANSIESIRFISAIASFNNGETNRRTAQSFNFLKVNYNRNGEYDYEDQAYVEYRRCMRKTKKPIIRALEWFFLDLISCYCTKPFHVFYAALIAIAFFACWYLVPGIILFQSTNQPVCDFTFLQCLWNSLYHSIITFFTIGYGNSIPSGWWGLFFTGLEGFIGVFLMSLFTVSFVRKVLR